MGALIKQLFYHPNIHYTTKPQMNCGIFM